MIQGRRILGLIPARDGSKGLPRKNLLRLGGHSLLEHAIAAGRAARTVDRLILSSEDPDIIQAAIAAGCEVPFIRPPELASDEARSVDVVRHALASLPERYDLLVLLQPTSPLRRAEDVDEAVKLCIRAGAPACVSVAPVDKSPAWTYRLDAAGRMAALLPEWAAASRRQDLPAVYAPNGAVYVATREWIMAEDSFFGAETVAYVMPRERSVDIDCELDLAVAETLLHRLESCDDTWVCTAASPDRRTANQATGSVKLSPDRKNAF